MTIQKKTLPRGGKPADQSASSVEASPLKATPFTAHTMAKKKKSVGFRATTLKRK